MFLCIGNRQNMILELEIVFLSLLTNKPVLFPVSDIICLIEYQHARCENWLPDRPIFRWFIFWCYVDPTVPFINLKSHFFLQLKESYFHFRFGSAVFHFAMMLLAHRIQSTKLMACLLCRNAQKQHKLELFEMTFLTDIH